MLPLAVVTTFAVAVSDGIDWSKASDDLRFASLKPVMTEGEVRRLRLGKKADLIGCGGDMDKEGNTVVCCDLGYSFKLKGRKVPLTISFVQIHQPKVMPWALVSFKIEGGATYRPNSIGQYVAVPTK